MPALRRLGSIRQIVPFDPLEDERGRSISALVGAADAERPGLRRALFPHENQRLVNVACELLRERLTKVDPWLDTTRRQPAAGNDEYAGLAMQLWYNACERLGVEKRDPGDEDIEQILDRTPRRFRDQVCERANTLVLYSFDFVDTYTLGKTRSSADMAKILVENRAKYAVLKDKFHYQDPNNTAIPNTMYQHQIIQDILIDMWFGEGAYVRSQYFADVAELPLVTMTFILTAIENGIDAWSSGRFKRVAFSHRKYQRRYQKHLDNLKRWKDSYAKEPYDLATQVLCSLLENARFSMPEELSMEERDEACDEAEDSESESEEAMLAMFAINQGRNA
ncbi:hypothetical protein BJ912DRAFT_1037362 [Pholiota molesta]|nr:hypothetical protein BJ912DRAFT_1037362 [Pholiota molesta]